MANELIPKKASDLAANTTTFTSFLQQFDLPTDNIIATTEEREIVATNLPQFLAALSTEEKSESRYLSKFVGATAIGLFDAGLNYVWNEVVLNLRRKAVIYGVDLFFDASVGGRNRDSYRTEEDLAGLKDTVLLDSCLKLELISDVVYRKLDHILTMRNEVAASHPNVESIGGYELLGWLQTCIKDVLQDRPSESAIRIKALIDNLKARPDAIDEHTQQRFREELTNLATPHVHNLLVTLFGMYVSPETEQTLRRNISLIAKAVWKFSADQVKYNVGITLDGYRANLVQYKLERGLEFLDIVDGRRYETLSARLIALDGLSERIQDVHNGWDNYYNEPPVMRQILRYCHKASDMPKEILAKLVKVVIKCRLGRGLSYCRGVSPAGRALYDQFVALLDDNGLVQVFTALFSPEINSKLQNQICQEHLAALVANMRGTAVSERLKEMCDFLLADIPNAFRAGKNEKFRDLSSPYLQWA